MNSYNKHSMRFKYETGVITLIQFILLSLLSLANSVNSIVTTCVRDGGGCIENMIPSILLFILISAWFAFIWILGYAAQDRRSWKLALLLIGAELGVAGIAFFSIKHHSDWLSLTTSSIDLILATWVILLAIRLIRSKGGRVVTKQRGRRRRRPPTAKL